MKEASDINTYRMCDGRRLKLRFLPEPDDHIRTNEGVHRMFVRAKIGFWWRTGWLTITDAEEGKKRLTFTRT